MKKYKSIISKRISKIAASLIILCSRMTEMIYAAPTGGLTSEADTKFNLIVNTIAGYGFKFGLLIIFYGAIQIGLAFKNDNPDGKVQGARTAIAGLIVAAVSAGADKFIS